MQLTNESKFFLGIIGVTIAIIAAAFILLNRPSPTISREILAPANSQTKGSTSASAYLVEFSDFQCPACRSFAPVVDNIVEKNKDKLLFVWRHYPLPQHKFAEKAAIAAEAAGLQGKFWEAVKVLFNNQENISDEFFSTQFTQLVQLDKVRFNKDIADPALAAKVKQDQDDGISLSVNATPTFFLNGMRLPPAANFDDFTKTIEQVLQ